MEISVMTYGHSLWENTIAFAETCSWRAGAFLAGKMRDNEFTDIERVLVAHKGEEIVAFCTFPRRMNYLMTANTHRLSDLFSLMKTTGGRGYPR